MSHDDARPRLAAQVGAPEPPDLHLLVREAIDAQLRALGTVALRAGGCCSGSSAVAIDQLVKSLRADRKLLGEHWAVDGPSTSLGPGHPPRSRACGEAQPCSHALALAKKYHVKHRAAGGTGMRTRSR